MINPSIAYKINSNQMSAIDLNFLKIPSKPVIVTCRFEVRLGTKISKLSWSTITVLSFGTRTVKFHRNKRKTRVKIACWSKSFPRIFQWTLTARVLLGNNLTHVRCIRRSVYVMKCLNYA